MSDILKNKTIIITSGPTIEPIDPVRFISNYSSGKQGFAIAKELAKFSDDVHLITSIEYKKEDLGNITIHKIKTAVEMDRAVKSLKPFNIAICVAAVADWRPEIAHIHKLKKNKSDEAIHINLIKNPDILANISQDYENRAELVIGFAAETENIRDNALKKRKNKECDWLLANDVSTHMNTFGGDSSQIYFISADTQELWNEMPKIEIAKKLAKMIINYFEDKNQTN